MPPPRPKRGWKSAFVQVVGLPQGVEAKVRKAARRLLPNGLSATQRAEKEEEIVYRFFVAAFSFTHRNAGAGGPAPGQVKAALRGIQKLVGGLIKKLQDLDEISAATLVMSKRPAQPLDPTPLDLRIQFKGVWDLEAALAHALQELREPDPARRLWLNLLDDSSLHLVTAVTRGTEDLFASALKMLALDIKRVSGKLPTTYWNDIKGRYEGTFIPLTMLLAKAVLPQRERKSAAWPASAARDALASARSKEAP